jgi:hypothetical protein
VSRMLWGREQIRRHVERPMPREPPVTKVKVLAGYNNFIWGYYGFLKVSTVLCRMAAILSFISN